MKLYEIGQKIRSLREERNLTQEELALKLVLACVLLILDILGFEIEFKTKQNFGIPNLDEIKG